MSILRIDKDTNFTTISNIHLRDKTISWKAKGLLTYLISLPNDWTIYIKHLEKQSTDGTDSTRTALNELIKAGYITKDYKRNEKGQITGRDYIVREKPTPKEENPKGENSYNLVKSGNQENSRLDYPTLEKPILDNPTLGNPTLLNTDGTPLVITNLTNDERQPPSLKSKQKNNHTQTTKLRSSSVVNIESSKDNSEQVKALFDIVPNNKQSELLKKEITKRLNVGFTPEAIEEALKYTILRSKGTPTQFKAYFGQTLDFGYDEDYKARKEEKEQEQKQKRQHEEDRKERERLKAIKERQEIEEIKAQNESKKKALESLKIENFDKYRETQEKAVEIYKKKYPNMKVDRDGLSIRIEMCQLLGI